MPLTVSPEPNQPQPHLAVADHRVELRCFSFEDRFSLLGPLLEALDQCGCWLESRRSTSMSQMELCFVAQLSAADDLYAGLISAGVEMSRESHLAMTWLCTLLRHRTEAALALATVSIKLEMNFLFEPESPMGFVSAGLA